MKLEEFDRRWIISVGAQPTVAITKAGTFALNRAAYEALGRAQAVKLLYGTEERVIGLRPTKNSPKAYPVKSYTKGKTYHVSGSKFCNFYEVLPKERRP